MFTFSHVTSIGLSEEQYQKALAAGEKNLVKGENKWYREVATEVTVPLTVEELLEIDGPSDKIKLGDVSHEVPYVVKHYIVGLKLAVNQKVQATNRDGVTDYKAICESVIVREGMNASGKAALTALATTAKNAKAFAEQWMKDHPEWKV